MYNVQFPSIMLHAYLQLTDFIFITLLIHLLFHISPKSLFQ